MDKITQDIANERYNNEHANKDHAFSQSSMPLFGSTQTTECAVCGRETADSIHLMAIQLHIMRNVPGQSACGLCGNSKKHELHIETSSSKNTYRKPILGRFDLIPPVALRRLSMVYEEGATTYGESKYVSSPMPHSNVVNHLVNHLNLAQSGDTSEDHWAKIAWAAFTMIVYEDLDIGTKDLTNYGVKPKDNS